ncbi:MAG: Gmad2 immunoglobulin-like domain-containing protein [Anaerosomatales bacterium]|nr:Gmad2 immunoglobulin-like domain-containing protein [Anaerosomatales bacterium]
MDPQRRLIVAALIGVVVVGAVVAASVLLRDEPPANGVRDGDGTVTPPSEQATDAPREPVPSAEPSVTPDTQQQRLLVYFVRDGVLGVSAREVPATKAVAAAATRQLVIGVTGSELGYGLSSELPVGVTLNGVSIAGGVATVDLSPQFTEPAAGKALRLRLAQLVFTLTQFRTVDAVRIEIDGAPLPSLGTTALDAPLARADFADVLPAILVEHPAPGESTPSPLRIRGLNNTFEATFIIEVLDPSGTRIARKVVTAGAMGEWRLFDVSVPYASAETGIGTLVVYEESARDGSAINVVRIPVKLLR